MAITKLFVSFVIYLYSFDITICQNPEECLNKLAINVIRNSSYNLRNSDEVIYNLYTRTNPVEPFNLNEDLTQLDSEIITKIIIHGFTESLDVQWYKDMIQAYLKRDNYNVMAVDWSQNAGLPYLKAASATQKVGIRIGNFLIALDKQNKLPLKNIHIIGHSLGAHISGLAGKQIYRLIKRKVPRITGLDPAGPLFEFPFTRPSSERLTKSDADFVDVIHTDGGWFGYKGSIGQADFFPNGGVGFQPGCEITKFNDITEYVCSHQRSHQFFIESINSKGFLGKSCGSWNDFQKGLCNENPDVRFGEDATSDFTGNFYLRTNPRSPFALN